MYPYNYKDEFVQIYNTYIHRDGASELLDYLENSSNFFIDPASTKYHLCAPEELAHHSLNVYKRLKWLCSAESLWRYSNEITKHVEELRSSESITICGLLHDLCKADTYEIDSEKSTYDKIVYKKNDTFPFGHGEKSVYIINKFMKLTDEEALAIRYHMASWNEWEKNDASRVFEKNTLAFLLHVADEWATFVDEVRE